MSAKQPEIEFMIDPQGNVHTTSRGFAGAECKAATKPYEEAIGTVTSDKPTPEMRDEAPKHLVKRTL